MKNVRHLVLDEADALLDDSFNESTTKFLQRFQVSTLKYVCTAIEFLRKSFKTHHFQIRSGPANDEDVKGVQLTLASATMPTSLDEILGDIVDVSLIRTD